MQTQILPKIVPENCFFLHTADKRIRLPKPCVMGIINMSPDSFYRPYETKSQVLKTIEAMVKGGATILDIGGEATNLFVDLENQNPTPEQQLDRILPVIEKVASEFDVLISVDTSHPLVMREAVKYGALMINDQRGLQLPGALETAAQLNVPVCLMHFFMQRRQPASSSPALLLANIIQNFQNLIQKCLQAGMNKEQILIDPGFGQGHYCKNVQENFYLLSHLNELTDLGFPVLVGWSRKSMIGDTLKAPPSQRLYGSIAAATIAAMQGASVIRVHDVAETMDAVRIVNAFRQELD